MTAALMQKVVHDPIGVVVEVVLAVEPTLDQVAVHDVVSAVAGGRAKQRRLAGWLLDNSSVLDTGVSPAPVAVGTLMIALRRAGATKVQWPRCAGCRRELRSLRRQGEDWFCGRCMPGLPCHVCGRRGVASNTNRLGQRVCRRCCPSEDDSVQALFTLVATADPGLGRDVVAAAVRAAAPGPGPLDRLVGAISDRPDLLTGNGAHAPMPSVLRLINLLCDAGAAAIVRPACPRCHRVVALSARRDGVWLCRNCVARSKKQPCARCGADREPATRDEQGRPLCAYCLSNDPANQEACIQCGRRRQVAVRGPDGPLCQRCKPRTVHVCAVCGRSAPCTISRATGQPWCRACAQHWGRCIGCGEVRVIRGGTREEPLCALCTSPEPELWCACPVCGTVEKMWGGPCARCQVEQRVRALLGDDAGTIRPHFRRLHQSLVEHDRPASVLDWLNRGATASLLRRIVADADPPTHAVLDELGESIAVRQLRSVLVAAEVLPPRDELMTVTERWVRASIAARPQLEQKVLHRYVVWHLLRRLRGRTAGSDTSRGQATSIRTRLRGAIVVFDWLSANGLTLQTCRQGDLDSWLASGSVRYRDRIGPFVRWAASQRLCSLELADSGWSGPAGSMDGERRWAQARRLLHDHTIRPDDRLAGLLVVLYAQSPFTISRLRAERVEATAQRVRIRLGREPIVLPPPLDGIARQALASRQTSKRAIGAGKASLWLFPGERAGQPMSAGHLADRLRLVGVEPKPDRQTAMFGLAAEVPAALLSRLLGISTDVAVTWQRAAAGSWLGYAAAVGRRSTPAHTTATGHGGP
jgi:hypothetical protein